MVDHGRTTLVEALRLQDSIARGFTYALGCRQVAGWSHPRLQSRWCASQQQTAPEGDVRMRKKPLELLYWYLDVILHGDRSRCTFPSLVQISTRTIRRQYRKSMISTHSGVFLCHHGWSAVISTSDDRPSPVPSAPRHDNVQLAALPFKTADGGRCGPSGSDQGSLCRPQVVLAGRKGGFLCFGLAGVSDAGSSDLPCGLTGHCALDGLPCPFAMLESPSSGGTLEADRSGMMRDVEQIALAYFLIVNTSIADLFVRYTEICKYVRSSYHGRLE